jgi:cobalt-zinc-cadmium efflux system membrane fusion protein
MTGCNREAAEAETKASVDDPQKPVEVVLDAEAQRRAGIEVQPVRLERVRETIGATGQLTVNEDQTWSAGAMNSGRIMTVGVKVGDEVTKGQVLARMQSHEVHDSRAAYKKAVLELARVQALESQARRLRDRARRLFDLKAMSQQELENAESELRNAEAAVAHARNELERERVHLEEFLEVPIEHEVHSTRHAEDLIPIRAPEPGIVIERKVAPGTVVSAGQEVFRITTPSSIWMTVNVNEADLSHLRPGQPVRVFVRAYPDRVFNGRVLRLGEELDPTTRTLKVRVVVPNTRGMLKPEMYASAEIDRGAGSEVLTVPDSAAQDLSGNRVVFVRMAPGRFAPRPIQTGRTVNGKTEVVAGLRAGDEVVVKGSFVLKSQLLQGTLAQE